MSLWITIAYASGLENSGLPQFNPEHFSSQIFWAIISFVTLLVLLCKYVLPVLRKILDDRARQIENDLNEAHEQRIKAEQILAEYQQQLAEAHQQAKLMMEQAHQQIIADQNDLKRDFEKKIQCKKDDFKIECAYAKEQAVKEVHNMAVQIAMLATAKLITHKVTRDEAREMVRKAIQELKIKSL